MNWRYVLPLGFATEYVFADGEGYFAKQCSFFQATLGKQVALPVEHDHRLAWLPIPTALARLVHSGHAWAVSFAKTVGDLLGLPTWLA